MKLILEYKGGSTEERTFLWTDSGAGSGWLLLQAGDKVGLYEKAGFLEKGVWNFPFQAWVTSFPSPVAW